jgi:hypothetical protein
MLLLVGGSAQVRRGCTVGISENFILVDMAPFLDPKKGHVDAPGQHVPKSGVDVVAGLK